MKRFFVAIEDFYYRRIVKNILKLSSLGYGFIVKGAEFGYNYEHIYNNRASGRYFVGTMIDRLFLNLPAVQATRERKDVLKGVLWNEICNNILLKRKTKIIDLASGGARYLRELKNEHLLGQVESICIDRNLDCVEMGRLLSREEGLRNIRFIKGDVFKLHHLKKFSNKSKWVPNVVTASGFFIYFNDDIVTKMIRDIYDVLPAKGLFVFQSYENLNTKKLMRKTMATSSGDNWTLYYRKPDFWRDLLHRVGFEDVFISRDKWLMNNVCVARKK
ncbi:MAG TPA: class I SAM-dependent methyltransferase family protein [Candidatus Omnitrophota bacterium]|nr:class I SAM-dependent methyltransferase family protein [Candidatus Omnitrophota bacterium]